MRLSAILHWSGFNQDSGQMLNSALADRAWNPWYETKTTVKRLLGHIYLSSVSKSPLTRRGSHPNFLSRWPNLSAHQCIITKSTFTKLQWEFSARTRHLYTFHVRSSGPLSSVGRICNHVASHVIQQVSCLIDGHWLLPIAMSVSSMRVKMVLIESCSRRAWYPRKLSEWGHQFNP